MPKTKHPSIKGKAAEDLVVGLLQKKGWEVLARNYRRVSTEIDAILYKDGQLVILEIKARKKILGTLNELENLLPRSKQKALERGASKFLSECSLPIDAIRFDLTIVEPPSGDKIGFGFKHLENIFTAQLS